ncbi:MAG: hypothetical protein WBN77_03215 [Desulfobacterales bacterium]
MVIKMVIKTFALCILLVITISTTVLADEAVKSGDKVQIQFTCRLGNGRIAATTDKEITDDPNIRKAPVFVARKDDKDLFITAGSNESTNEKRTERNFENEIIDRIAKNVVGMKQGESKNLVFEAPAPPPALASMGDNEDMVIRVARERTRPKQIMMTKKEYREKAGKEPEIGQTYNIWRAVSIPCSVVSVSEEKVVVQCHAKTGERMQTPFGEGVVSEKDNEYRILIDAKKGDLIRTAGMAGRIVNVDDRLIAIDYSNPFGYETLKCEVLVNSVNTGEKAETGIKEHF